MRSHFYVLLFCFDLMSKEFVARSGFVGVDCSLNVCSLPVSQSTLQHARTYLLAVIAQSVMEPAV